MAQRSRVLVSIAVVLASFVGCGGDSSSDSGSDPSSPASEGAATFDAPVPSDAKAYPVFVSSELVVGPNRMLVGLLDSNDAPIGSPRIELDVDLYDLAESADEPVTSARLDFIEIQTSVRGYYAGQVEFPSAGKWGAEVNITGEGLDETVRGSIEVKKESSTPSLGARPPASKTPTASDARRIADISTDKKPDPRFYEMSIAEAIRSGEPAVVVFATPQFCSSQVCGPTLDIVKGVSKDFPRVNFVHVEPYDLTKVPDLEPVPSVLEWGLPGEPWIFVTDRKGRIAAKFEAVIAPQELSRVLAGL